MKTLRSICLETTLKPFHDKSDSGLKAASQTLFRQWLPLIEHGETLDLLLWVADGSELLDYNRNLDDTFEWARFIGSANPHSDAKDNSIASKPFFYRDDAPSYSYRDLQRVIATLKSVGRDITGKLVRIGTIFDPGPEFAKSAFKYDRHPEICTGNPSAGSGCGKTFVYCAERLKADSRPYAGYPQGIPDGTPFGAFLGRQTTCYCADFGFDFLWLSNGIGFGKDTWGIIGSTFDKTCFSVKEGETVRAGILEFWREFRRECPTLPVRTRGTNSTASVDIATDAVPLREIYSQVNDLEIPPNSPWAPLNGDMGMELAGWMSHIAEVPEGKSYLFRYYIHDPWWAFSPWLHQHQRQAQDIYLPLAIARLDGEGRVQLPENLSLLTIDDSYGQMPPEVPQEVIPQLLASYATAPDAAGPVVWLYPFDEYHELTFNQRRYEEVFFGDMFLRAAINLGFPVNTVVSTRNFVSMQKRHPLGTENLLLAPTAVAETPEVFDTLQAFLAAGGKVLLYGPATSPSLLTLLSQERVAPIEGDVMVEWNGKPLPARHTALLSGGPLETQTRVVTNVTEFATYAQDSQQRTAAVRIEQPEWNGGQLIWVRGTNSIYIAPSGFDAPMLDANRFYYPENLLRESLKTFGWSIDFLKPVNPQQLAPRLNFRRHANALHLAAFAPDTSVGLKLRAPEGAPIFVSTDAVLDHGAAIYHPGRAINWECRVFVEQNSGLIQCLELPPRAPRVKRRLGVSGLENATLRFHPEVGFEKSTTFLRESDQAILTPTATGASLELRNVSGSLQIYW